MYSHTFKNLSIEGLTINNARLVLMPSLAEQEIRHMRVMCGGRRLQPPVGERQPEIVLGMAALRQLHVCIDYGNQAVYFTPATPGGDFPKAGAAAPGP